MPINVHAPDGSVVQFPDGTDPNTIKAALIKHFGAPDPAAAKAYADAQAGLATDRNLAFGSPASKASRQQADMAVKNGFLFNRLPEVAGAGAAAVTALRNLVGLGPGYSAGQAYAATRDVNRAALNQGQHAHPIGSTLATIGGGAINPATIIGGEWAGAAPSIGGKIIRGVAAGAGPGFVADGLKGAVVGAGAGGALPVLASGVGAVARRGVNAAGATAQRVQAALGHVEPDAAPTPNDTLTAAQKVAQLVSTSGKTLDKLPQHPAAQAGLPVTTAEAIGRPGVTSLAALGRRAGATPDILQATLAERAQGVPGRIHDAFADASGIHPEAAAGDIEGLVERLQKDAGPLYDAVRNNPDAIWSPELANLAQRPVIKRAIASVANDELNAGRNPMTLGLKLDPDTGWTMAGGGVNPQTGGVEAPNAAIGEALEPQPTARTWDLVKKAIGRQVERNQVTGRPLPDSQSEGNFGVRTASQDLTNVLAGDPANGTPGAIPGYRAALDKAGDYLQLSDAFDRGGKLLTNPNVNEKTFAGVYNGLSDAEQQAFKGGFANKLYDLAQNGRLTPRTFIAPRVQEKISTILGPDAADDFLSKVGMERDLAATGSRMAPGQGSPTMELGQAGAEQDHGADALGMLGGLMHNPLKLIKSLPQIGADAPTTPQVRNEMGRLLLQPPQDTADEIGALLQGLPVKTPTSFSALSSYATPTVAATLPQLSQPAQ